MSDIILFVCYLSFEALLPNCSIFFPNFTFALLPFVRVPAQLYTYLFHSYTESVVLIYCAFRHLRVDYFAQIFAVGLAKSGAV